jgi:transposase
MAEAAQKLPSDPEQLRAIIAQMAARAGASWRLRCVRATKRSRSATARSNSCWNAWSCCGTSASGRRPIAIAREQLALFDEAELNVLLEELDAQIAEAKAPPRSERTEPKQTPKRKPLPAHLPRVERILDLPEEEQAAIAATHVRIGFDESEQLGVLPKQYYVIKIKRAKYAPIHADMVGAEAGIRIAPRPAQILPKAIAHSSLLAEVVTAKFVDGLPLYRQEKIFAREGIELSRQTLSGWIVQLATPLAPVMAALKQYLTQGPVLQIDETPVQVLDEPGRANTTKSYMWVYRGGPAWQASHLVPVRPKPKRRCPDRVPVPGWQWSTLGAPVLSADGWLCGLSRVGGERRHPGPHGLLGPRPAQSGRGGQWSDQDRCRACVRGPDRQVV